MTPDDYLGPEAEVGPMAGFVVIDFETANELRGSPCAVGYAVVEQMEIVESGAFFIRPPEFRFEDFNVALHGVTPEMCRSAPPWPEALQRLVELIGGRLVVAHYAPFDIGVLRDACAMSGSPCPELHFACTRQIARLVWPELGSYSLPDVVAHCGAGQFAHHDAESDAVAAAHVALSAAAAREAKSLPVLLSDLRIISRTLEGGLYASLHVGHHVPRTPTDGKLIDPDHPFYRKKVAFTGGMMSMTREQAQQSVINVGGRGVTSVSKLTDFVVVGGEFHGLLAGHEASGKLEKALDLQKQGCPIELLDEVDFISVLRGGA
jgi:DNA polymerase III epsilon subunit-like protein